VKSGKNYTGIHFVCADEAKNFSHDRPNFALKKKYVTVDSQNFVRFAVRVAICSTGDMCAKLQRLVRRHSGLVELNTESERVGL
jgi:hypothetical protein